MRLSGTVAIVTGAAQGIGLAYARRLAREGATAILVDVRGAEAEAAAEQIRAEGLDAVALVGDVASEASMEEVAGACVGRYGRIDTLINNAALFGNLDFRDQSIEYLERVIRVNVLGVLIASRAVFPTMKAQRSGSIINIASTAAYEYVTQDRLKRDQQTIPSFSYSLTKAGVISLTKFMAGTIGKYGIRVNCICPGMTLSETALRVVSPEDIDAHSKTAAMQTTLAPEDITGTAVYLASDDSRFVTGQVVMVDAGHIMPA